MNEYKIYLRFPKWILPGYIIILGFFIFSAINAIINQDILSSITNTDIIKIYVVLSPYLGILMFSFGLYMVIQVDFFNKYCYTINNEGISVNEVNLLKKNIKWDSELYYSISKSYFGLYSYKRMLPLNNKIINEKNIEEGYIIIKTKKALKIKMGNKGLICIPTKWVKNNVKINDIVGMINKSLE
jgi:hypothetical protein